MLARGIKVEFESFCPDCGSQLFHVGPRGGLAHHIMCAQCRSKFWFSPPSTPERVHSEDRFFRVDVSCTLAQIASFEYIDLLAGRQRNKH
jgi:hypothetical protein